MSSTYTPNLGIEQPATGAYANTWGTVANRSYAVLDAAIGGSAQLTLTGVPGTPQQLVTTPGSDGSQHGLLPLIVWTGPQTAAGAVTIVPATEQRIFIMRNRTAATIQFGQSSGGAQFTLQPGYDAQIYCDAASPSANVAGAILNPQYGNVLVTGVLQVNGGVAGNFNFASLGVGFPASVPDTLTVAGLGPANMAQIRLVESFGSNCGVAFRNDGSTFTIAATAPGDPYGPGAKAPLFIDLVSGAVGVGGSGASPSYGLTSSSAHLGSLFVDAGVYCVNLDVTNAAVVDGANTNNGFGLDILFGPGSGEGIGSGRVAGSFNPNGLTFFTGSTARVALTSSGALGIGMMPDQALTVNGYIHTLSGVVFPDGSVQSTAAVSSGGSFAQLTVTGNASIGGNETVGGTLGVTGLVTVNNNINLTAGHTYQINGVPFSAGISGVAVYVGGLSRWDEPGIAFASGFGIQVTSSYTNPGSFGTVTISNTQSSDARVKRNVRPLQGGLSVIGRLRVVEAEYNGLGGTRDGERTVGVIAQELAQVLPGCVVPVRERLRAGDAEETEVLHVHDRELLFQLILAMQQLYERSEMHYKRDKA